MTERADASSNEVWGSKDAYKDLEKSINSNIEYRLPAPHLDQAIATAAGDILLDNVEYPDGLNTARYAKVERATYYAVREEEYLHALREYLENCLEVALEHDPEDVAYDWRDRGPKNELYGDVADEIRDVIDNLVYINNAEFERATDVMAEKIITDAQSGRQIGIYDYRDRSPRYVITKVLAKVLRTLDSASNFDPAEADKIKSRIHYDYKSKRIARTMAAAEVGSDPAVIYVIDDFALSHTLINGAINTLKRERNTDEAMHDIEITGLTICSNPSQNTENHIETIIEPPEAQNFTKVAVAGSWSSTDYGYENVLSKIAERVGIAFPLDKQGNWRLRDHRIKGRYEKDSQGDYLDPQYHDEYQTILASFGPDSL